MTPTQKEEPQIKMFKDGEWVKWNGADVSQIIVEETITLTDVKRDYPEQYKKWVESGLPTAKL